MSDHNSLPNYKIVLTKTSNKWNELIYRKFDQFESNSNDYTKYKKIYDDLSSALKEFKKIETPIIEYLNKEKPNKGWNVVTSNWLNGSAIYPYFWLKIKQEEYKKIPISLSLFVQGKGTTEYRLCLEYEGYSEEKFEKNKSSYNSYVDKLLNVESDFEYTFVSDKHNEGKNYVQKLDKNVSLEDVKEKMNQGKVQPSKYIKFDENWENKDYQQKILDGIRSLIPLYDYVIEKYNQIDIEKLEKNQPLPLVNKNNTSKRLILPKPFIIFAGISGTGKTKIIRDLAGLTNGTTPNNYHLEPVRPDWHEPSELLGYVSKISGTKEFLSPGFLSFIVKAWKHIYDVVKDNNGHKIKPSELSTTEISSDLLSSIQTFWLCLDEMNLAPVELYLADYLSILETRRWEYKGDQNAYFTYRSDPLVKKDVFADFDNRDSLIASLIRKWNLDDKDDDKALVEDFVDNGIPLPFNLVVAGTVNMDETTHGFSRKVLDRALSFDFTEFFPNQFGDFFNKNNKDNSLALAYSCHSDGKDIKSFVPNDGENLGKQMVNYLSNINDFALKDTPFELGFRALNELLLSLISYKDKIVALVSNQGSTNFSANEVDEPQLEAQDSNQDSNNVNDAAAAQLETQVSNQDVTNSGSSSCVIEIATININKKVLLSILDDFVMTKVLPRIEGDTDKLSSVAEGKICKKGTQDKLKIDLSYEDFELSVLHDLAFVLVREFGRLGLIDIAGILPRTISSTDGFNELFENIQSNIKRYDLMKVKADGSFVDLNGSRSLKKILWMLKKLEKTSYTGFWR